MKKMINIISLLTLCSIQMSHANSISFDPDLSYYENLEQFYNSTHVPAKVSFFATSLYGKSLTECVVVTKKNQGKFLKSNFVFIKNPKKSTPTVQGGPLFKKIPNTPKNSDLLTLENWKNKPATNEIIGNDFVITTNKGLSKGWLRATDDYVFYKGEARASRNSLSQEVYGYCWKK